MSSGITVVTEPKLLQRHDVAVGVLRVQSVGATVTVSWSAIKGWSLVVQRTPPPGTAGVNCFDRLLKRYVTYVTTAVVYTEDPMGLTPRARDSTGEYKGYGPF